MTMNLATKDKAADTLGLIWARKAIRSGVAADLRRQAGLSQAEVAAAIGVTKNAVQKWEAGDRIPRSDAAIRYARFLLQLADTMVKWAGA